MSQKIKIPEIKNCHCGATARIMTNPFSYDLEYRVECVNNHHLTKFCGTINRAIHRWNNRVSTNCL